MKDISICIKAVYILVGGGKSLTFLQVVILVVLVMADNDALPSVNIRNRFRNVKGQSFSKTGIVKSSRY